MNRRSFLASLAGALVVDPERALWKPGAKLISIPRPAVVTVREFYNLKTGDKVTFYGDWKTYVIRECVESQRAYNAFLSLQAETIDFLTLEQFPRG